MLDNPPFLHQPRAQNALRRELDRLSGALESRNEARSERDAAAIVELSTSPNRFIARDGDIAVSFSWLAGRLGGIPDGHLLVIEWTGIASGDRGSQALKAAGRGRETAYHAEATASDDWCWREGVANGRAFSTADLVGEWFGRDRLPQAAPGGTFR